MTEEQYWERDPWLTKAYRDAHMLRNEQKNHEFWLQGLYNYRAFMAGIGEMEHFMNGRKGNKPDGYIEQPIRITPFTEQEKQDKAEQERQKVIESLTGWERAWSKKQT